jgi:hypothetical protein
MYNFYQTPITPQNDLPAAYEGAKNGVESPRTDIAAVRRAPEGMDCEINNDKEQIALGECLMRNKIMKKNIF